MPAAAADDRSVCGDTIALECFVERFMLLSRRRRTATTTAAATTWPHHRTVRSRRLSSKLNRLGCRSQCLWRSRIYAGSPSLRDRKFALCIEDSKRLVSITLIYQSTCIISDVLKFVILCTNLRELLGIIIINISAIS